MIIELIFQEMLSWTRGDLRLQEEAAVPTGPPENPQASVIMNDDHYIPLLFCSRKMVQAGEHQQICFLSRKPFALTD